MKRKIKEVQKNIKFAKINDKYFLLTKQKKVVLFIFLHPYLCKNNFHENLSVEKFQHSSSLPFLSHFQKNFSYSAIGNTSPNLPHFPQISSNKTRSTNFIIGYITKVQYCFYKRSNSIIIKTIVEFFDLGGLLNSSNLDY